MNRSPVDTHIRELHGALFGIPSGFTIIIRVDVLQASTKFLSRTSLPSLVSFLGVIRLAGRLSQGADWGCLLDAHPDSWMPVLRTAENCH